MKLEDLLRRIHPNSAPLFEILTDLILAHRCRTEAVHTNTIRGRNDERVGARLRSVSRVIPYDVTWVVSTIFRRSVVWP
jgi:hypothetical protein